MAQVTWCRAALCWTAMLSLAGCEQAPLVRDLKPSQAEHLTEQLHAAGISAQLHARDGTRVDVSVPKDHVAQAVKVLDCRATLEENDPCQRPQRAGLLPSPRAEATQQRERLGCALARDAEMIPGVLRARIHLSDITSHQLDDTHPRMRAVIVAQVDSHRFDPLPLRSLVTGAVAHLSAEDTTLITSAVDEGNRASAKAHPATPAWNYFGPIRVHPQDSSAFRFWLGGLLVTHAGLALCLWVIFRRFIKLSRGAQQPTLRRTTLTTG